MQHLQDAYPSFFSWKETFEQKTDHHENEYQEAGTIVSEQVKDMGNDTLEDTRGSITEGV